MHTLVSSPDSLFVFGWGGSLVDRANIFVPALECRSQVLVCRFGSVRCMNIIITVLAWRVIPRRSVESVLLFCGLTRVIVKERKSGSDTRNDSVQLTMNRFGRHFHSFFLF